MRRLFRKISLSFSFPLFVLSSCYDVAVNFSSSVTSTSSEESFWIGGREILFDYSYYEFTPTFLVGEGGASRQKVTDNRLQIYAGVASYQERFASWQESETEYFSIIKAFFRTDGKFVKREIHRLDGFLSNQERYRVSVDAREESGHKIKVDAEFAYSYTDSTDYNNIPLKEGYVAFLFSRPATVTKDFDNAIAESPIPIKFEIDGDDLHYYIDEVALNLVSLDYEYAFDSRDCTCD